MHRPPPIQTERLLLRAFELADADDVFTYARNPNVLRYTTGRTPATVAETQVFVRELMRKPEGAFAWAVCLREKKGVIGAVEFGIPDGVTGEVHCALAEDFWNQGIMTEAARAVLDWAFRTHAHLEHVVTSAIPDNRGSCRVLEKCGLTFQGTIQEEWEKSPEPVTLSVYAISREAWQRNAADQNP